MTENNLSVKELSKRLLARKSYKGLVPRLAISLGLQNTPSSQVYVLVVRVVKRILKKSNIYNHGEKKKEHFKQQIKIRYKI